MEEKIKYFTQKELQKIFNKIEKRKDYKYNLRDLCMFRVAYRCGLRPSELGLIKIEDFNPFTKELFCHRLKGSQNNTIRLDDKTAKLLNKYVKNNLDEDDIIFQTQNKSPVSRQLLDKLIRYYCEEAGIQDKTKWHLHTLKHTCAVHLAESGVDIKDLQQYLGHKNIQNTLKYFAYMSKQQDDFYARIDNSVAFVK